MGKGWHWDGFYEYLFNGYLLRGAATTLGLTLAAIAGGLIVGCLLALLRLSPYRWMSLLAQGYIWVFRGTPLLVQLIIIYTDLRQAGIDDDELDQQRGPAKYPDVALREQGHPAIGREAQQRQEATDDETAGDGGEREPKRCGGASEQVSVEEILVEAVPVPPLAHTVAFRLRPRRQLPLHAGTLDRERLGIREQAVFGHELAVVAVLLHVVERLHHRVAQRPAFHRERHRRRIQARQRPVEITAFSVFCCRSVDGDAGFRLPGAQRLVGGSEIIEGADGQGLEALVGQRLVELLDLALLEAAELDADCAAGEVFGLRDLERIALGHGNADRLLLVGDHLHHFGPLLGPEDASIDNVPASRLEAGDHRRE